MPDPSIRELSLTEFEQRVFSGWTSRWLFGEKGRYSESFDLCISDETPIDLPNYHVGAELVGSYRFQSQPKLGPAVIYRRSLSTDTERFDVDGFFAGNLAVSESEPRRIVDARNERYMPERQFWSLVELAERDLQNGNSETLTDALVDAGDRAVLKFANTLAAKLLALDHPLNANLDRDQIHEEPDEASLAIRCFIVASGQFQFTLAIKQQGSLAWRPEMRSSLSVLRAAPDAYARLTGGRAAFLTRDQYFTRANVRLWNSEIGRKDSVQSPTVESDSLAGWYAEHSPRVMERLYGGVDAVWDSAAALSWRFRACRLVLVGQTVDELVVLISAPQQDSISRVTAEVMSSMPLEEEQKITHIETLDTRWIRLTPGPERSIPNIFRILRKSALSSSNYRAEYRL
jgi:hypothetical protein